MSNDDETIERWKEEVNAQSAREYAEYQFYRKLVDGLRSSNAFDQAPDSDSLHDIAEYAIRLAYTCHKEHPNGGYGIKMEFIKAVRNHRRDT